MDDFCNLVKISKLCPKFQNILSINAFMQFYVYFNACIPRINELYA